MQTLLGDEFAFFLKVANQGRMLVWNPYEVYKWIDEPPMWEKLYLDDGTMIYEGFTINHKAYGPGTCFFPDGKPRQEGIWGIKGLLSGREYYPNGQLRFEGVYRLNQAYSPNEPLFGSFYDKDGSLKYKGKFSVCHSSLGYPRVIQPEEFGSVQGPGVTTKYLFLWDDARKFLKRSIEESEKSQPSD